MISVLLQQQRSYHVQGKAALLVLSCSGLHRPVFRRWRPKNKARSALGRVMVLVTFQYGFKQEGSQYEHWQILGDCCVRLFLYKWIFKK